ncbi:hypothetical protein CEXT_443521 [Caerostris extrusa]|uniref:Uncharacterized protein n=1 Tax=Caerostris extrusa TaxID=172846 RepID=A0AAV4U2A0_CAEEX|nr:hypothetical protein CEXT_443521 [Caerostris extrusa]
MSKFYRIGGKAIELFLVISLHNFAKGYRLINILGLKSSNSGMTIILMALAAEILGDCGNFGHPLTEATCSRPPQLICTLDFSVYPF